jgi:YVTN family beta-propeller protein
VTGTSERLTGTVTFLFTDIEGSTRLLRELRDSYEQVRSEHDGLLRAAVAAQGGAEVDTQGDSFFFSFRGAKDAVAAAAAAQHALLTHPWPDAAALRVRMGLHSGEPAVGEDGRYVGLAVHRAARIASLARGGQVLLSSTTAGLVADNLPDGVSVRDFGRHALKDFDQPERISQLVVEGLPSLPRKRSRHHRRHRLAVVGAVILLAGGVAAAVAAITIGGSESTTSVVVKPNSVAVIDPHTDEVVADVGVGRYPNVVTGLGAVWTANRNAGTITRIDPDTYEAQDFPFADSVTGIATGSTAVWAADPTSGTIASLDPAYSRPGQPIVVSQPESGPGAPNGSAPGPIAVGFDSVWVGINLRASEIVRIDITSHAVVKRFEQIYLGGFGGYASAGDFEGAGAMTRGEGAVWAAAPGEGALLRIDPELELVRRIAVPYAGGGPVKHNQSSAVAVGFGAVWVTLPTDNSVWRFDPATSSTRTIPVGRSPSGIAAGENYVWVANEVEGTVSKIDPASNEVVDEIPVRSSAGSVAVAYGRVWVAVRG